MVDQMTRDERLAMSALISQRNDPLAVLPTELIVKILCHLPIFAPWQLQAVNKTWQSLLSSDDISRAALGRWDTHDASDSSQSSTQVAHEAVKNRLRHVRALRGGRPFSVSQIRCELPSLPWPSLQILALKGSRLAYVCASTANGHSLVVKDLTTGTVMTLRGDAREAIGGLALGSDLVAFATHAGKVYARDLADTMSSTRSVRLPSAAVAAMHVDQRVVGLLLNRGELVSVITRKTAAVI